MFDMRKLVYIGGSILNYILYYFGVYHYIFKHKTKNGIDMIFLAYHSVPVDSVKYPGLEVSKSNFEKQIRFLKKYFDIIDIDTALGLLKNNDEYKNKVVITFDDGYLDNYTNAYPILNKYNLPATIFLTVDPILNNGYLWGNELDLAIANTAHKSVNIPSIGSIDLYNQPQKMRATRKIKKYLKTLNDEDRLLQLGQILKMLNIRPSDYNTDRYKMLNKDVIREMSLDCITFGSHTKSHPIMSKLTTSETRSELIDSKKVIERWTEKEVKHFAYPNGKAEDYTEETKSELKKLNFASAFSLIRGTNNPDTDRYELKRLPIKDCNVPELASFLHKYI